MIYDEVVWQQTGQNSIPPPWSKYNYSAVREWSCNIPGLGCAIMCNTKPQRVTMSEKRQLVKIFRVFRIKMRQVEYFSHVCVFASKHGADCDD